MIVFLRLSNIFSLIAWPTVAPTLEWPFRCSFSNGKEEENSFNYWLKIEEKKIRTLKIKSRNTNTHKNVWKIKSKKTSLKKSWRVASAGCGVMHIECGVVSPFSFSLEQFCHPEWCQHSKAVEFDVESLIWWAPYWANGEAIKAKGFRSISIPYNRCVCLCMVETRSGVCLTLRCTREWQRTKRRRTSATGQLISNASFETR